MEEGRSLELRRELHDLMRPLRGEGEMEVLNRLLYHPQATAMIQAMHPEELHQLLLRFGRNECVDILRYVTEGQFHGLLDLDAWTADRLLPERIDAMILLANQAGLETLGELFEGMDDETLGIYLLRRARFIPRTFEPEQDDELPTDMEVFTSPDTMFYVLTSPGSDDGIMIRMVLEKLYYLDRDRAGSILRTLHFEDADVLEHDANGLRAGRLSSYGFPSLDESEELYRFMNPVRAKQRILDRLDHLALQNLQADTLLPVLYHQDKHQPVFLAKAIGRLEDDSARQRLGVGVSSLVTHVIVREARGDLADEQGRQASVIRALGLYSLGLEFVSSGDLSIAARVLPRVLPRTLFRIGLSLLLLLRGRARRLLELGGTAQGFLLFDPPLDDVVRGAALDVPQYFGGLIDEDQTGWRDFRTYGEYRTVRSALKQAEGVANFVSRTLYPGLEDLAAAVPEALRPAITHTTLLATSLVNVLLGNERLLAPIPKQRFPQVMSVLLVTDQRGERVVNPLFKASLDRFLNTENNRFAVSLVELSLRKLETVFLRLPRDTIPEIQMLAGVVLMGNSEDSR